MYAQVRHRRRRPVRVDRAAALEQVADSACAPEDEHLRAQDVDEHDVAVLGVPCAVRQPVFLLRNVEQVADERERLRPRRERERALPRAPSQDEQGKRSGDTGGDVRREGEHRQREGDAERIMGSGVQLGAL
jgi:hypothetical protein